MQKKLQLLIYFFFVFSSTVLGQQICNAPQITDVLGGDSALIDCNYPANSNCFNLKANYSTFFQTSSYSVSSQNYAPYVPYNSGTPLNVNADDIFTNKVDLPFNFCYFGNNYNAVVIGSNGIITFDTEQLGNINYPNIENPNPDSTLPKNSIFGVFSDLVFSSDDDSEIYYTVIGTAPCRKFIISFYKGRILGCDQTTTSQIVLSEGSNAIEVFVENRPLACSDAKFKNALVGIINADGSLGYSPIGRNSGEWASQNESWIFAPTGNAIVPSISWYNSANVRIGGGETLKVCPTKGEIYTVKISYPTCGDLNLVAEDSFEVKFAADYPLAKDYTKILCSEGSYQINLDDYRGDLTPQDPNNLSFSYHNSLADAQAGVNPQPTNFTLTDNRKYYVRIQNKSDANCYRVAVLNLILIAKSLITDKVEVCDVNNDGIENNYKLSTLNSQLFTVPLNGTIHYFLTQQDAANNTNEVTVANLASQTQLFVNYQTAACTQTFGPITVNFIAGPDVNTPVSYSLTTCDFARDFAEPFDYQNKIGPLVTNDPTVKLSFYASYDEAYTGIGAILNTVKEGKYAVYVRVEFPGGCFSIATINLDITFTKVEAKDKAIYFCFDGTQDFSIDLDNYAPTMLAQSPIGIKISYYSSADDAESAQNPISNNQTVTDNGNFVSKAFYVRFEDATGCYAVKLLKINLVHVVIAKSTFQACDRGNNGEEVVTLSTFSKQIIGSQNATVTYHLTQEDAENSANAVANYNVVNSVKLFARIESYDCVGIFQINISLTATPIVTPTVDYIRGSVCDNNNDGAEEIDLTVLEPKIYSGSDPVNFQYFTGYNSADNSLSGLIADPTAFKSLAVKTVYAKVSFNGGCYSVSTINIKLSFLPTIVLRTAVLRQCDYEFNLNERFDLAEAIPQLFLASENSYKLTDLDISYYGNEKDANIGDPSTQIQSPVTTKKSKEVVWIRFAAKDTSCYSVAPVELQTYLPPKAMNSVIKDLCDDNLDGKYDVDLTLYKERMVYLPDEENTLTFFYSKADADTNVNPITNPQTFSFDPSLSRIWVRVENIPGCFDTASVDLGLGKKIIFDDAGPFTIQDCDSGNDGKESIDLTRFEKTIFAGTATFEYYPTFTDINNYSNKIANPKSYSYSENAGPQKIFAKVTTAGFCPDFVEINLSLKKTPMFTLPDYFYCPEGSVDITPDFSGLDIVSFEWIDPSGKIVSTTNKLLGVKTAGTYKINVKAGNGCTFSTTFQAKVYEVPVITKLVASGNSYTVIATGSKKILYSVDGLNYQESNVFNNLPFGVITFYVKFEGSDCQPSSKKGLILDIPNVFTPNADGINDTWIIKDLNVFDNEKTNLKVFNRYQVKVYEEDSATQLEWDGKTASRVVNTDSYWYIITLPDGREFTGWVVVKNRN